MLCNSLPRALEDALGASKFCQSSHWGPGPLLYRYKKEVLTWSFIQIVNRRELALAGLVAKTISFDLGTVAVKGSLLPTQGHHAPLARDPGESP